jgi:hypothetical protein
LVQASSRCGEGGDVVRTAHRLFCAYVKGVRRPVPKRRFLMAAALLATALCLGAAPAANAGDTDNLYSEQACNDPTTSEFDFHIYYNSGENGAYRNIGYSVYDFADVP